MRNIDGVRPSTTDGGDGLVTDNTVFAEGLAEIKKDQEVYVILTLNTGGLIDANADKASVIFVKEVLKVGADGANKLVDGTETALLGFGNRRCHYNIYRSLRGRAQKAT